jgi:hypothetical protein
MAEHGKQEELSDEAVERIRRERFEQRVNRVLQVMREQRVDWRGVPYITPEGRIAVRIVPVEMDHPPGGP